MFYLGEIDGVERFRQASLTLVIILLAATLLLLLSFLALPELILAHNWLLLASISIIFFIMASFILVAQLLMGNRRVFHMAVAALFLILASILIASALSIYLSLSPTSSEYMGSILIIAIFVVILWDTMTILKRWVDADNRLMDIFHELGLLMHLYRYTICMAGVILLTGAVLVEMPEILSDTALIPGSAALIFVLVLYGLADLEKDKALSIAGKRLPAQQYRTQHGLAARFSKSGRMALSVLRTSITSICSNYL